MQKSENWFAAFVRLGVRHAERLRTFFKIVLVMKLTVFFLTIACFNLFATGISQTVTLSGKNLSLKSVFTSIEKQTGYLIFINRDNLENTTPVTVSVRQMPLVDFLDKVSETQRITYIIEDNTIMFSRGPGVDLPFPFVETAAEALPPATVSGVIRNAAAEPVAGVSVRIKGSSTGTSTNERGAFLLTNLPENAVLEVSSVGYESLEIRIGQSGAGYTAYAVNADKAGLLKVTPGANLVIDIQLEESVSELEEYVVTAYGKKLRKEAVVGSVTTVNPGELKTPASNLTNALAGRIAGVVAYQRSGQPGQDNASFFVRGVTTYGYKQDPLILIDNIELTASDLARLQVDDIASFSILKDASATALYGARGANGVILVTTKEGKEGKAKISVRLENSTSQAVQSIQLADPITYMKLFNEASVGRNPLSPAPFDQNKILNTEATLSGDADSNPYAYPAVDWLGLLFKERTSNQRVNMNISGGGPIARYYVAGTYNVDNGNLRKDVRNIGDNNIKFRNYQLRSNVNINLSKSSELIVRLAGTFNEYNGPQSADGGFSTDLYNVAMHTSPVLFPAWFPPDSSMANARHILFGNIGGSSSNSLLYQNPYASLLRGNKQYSESRMSAQVELNQKLDFLTEGLSARAVFNTNRYSYFDFSMAYSPYYYNISNYNKLKNSYDLVWLNPQAVGENVATEYLQYTRGTEWQNTFIYLQGILEYAKSIGLHGINSSIVVNRQQTLYSGQPTLIAALPYRNLGIAGRAGYSFDTRYFFEFNFGYNGSERFSENNRYGFFPTVGVSWMLSNEKFWEPLSDVISRFKLRGTYGLVGNDAIGSQRFFYMSDVNLNGGNPATFGSNNQYTRNGVYINNYSNTGITWETSEQTNLGIEMTLFRDLSIIAEFYKQYRYNILQPRQDIPATLGLEGGDTPLSANIGTAYSKGIDLHMNYRKTINKDWWASALGNLTLTSGRYGHYEELQWKEEWRRLSGQPINRFKGYIAERLFVDDKEVSNSPTQIFEGGGRPPRGGDIKYRDLNNDGKIDEADMTYFGYPTSPELVYGFGFSSGFKAFELSAFFQGLGNTSLFIDPQTTSPFANNTQLLKSYADDHWSRENQNLYALYPRMATTPGDLSNNSQPSSWWMQNGSFMRLKSLEIAYNLPGSLLQKMKVASCRVYLNGLNLFTFSEFDLWDPEMGGNGFNYPNQKVFNVGVNITL